MVPASRLRVLRFRWVVRFRRQIPGAVRGTDERHESSPFEHAVEQGLSEMVVVENLSPVLQAFVGGEDDGPVVEIAAIYDTVENVGGIVDVRQVADLIDVAGFMRPP